MRGRGNLFKKIKKSINATLVSALVISSFPIGDIEVKAEDKKSIPTKTLEFTAPNTLSDALLPPAELSNEETLVQQGPKPGTYTLTTFDDEIQVKNDQKKWVKVNTELKQNSEADYIPIATDLEVKFDSKIDNKTPLLKVGDKINENIAYVLKGVETDRGIQPIQSSQASVVENSILHPNILNGVDLRHIVLNKEVKEDIILKQNVPGLKAFVYEINTPLQAVLDKKGHIEFKNTKDEVVYSMPVPMMSDSNKDSKSGLSAESYDIEYDLKSIGNGYELKLIPDSKWITDEDRVFPLYIDPSVAKDASLDTFVSSASPTTSYNKYWNSSLGEYVLRVGKYDTATGTNYSFVKMPALSELKGAEISAASLKTYVKWNYYAGTKTGLWVDRVNSNWSETGVTWDTKPSSTNITSTTVSRDQWATFNVLSAMRTIADGSRTDYGFKFHTNGNGQTYWKQLTASENSKNKTNLSVTYSYPQMSSLKTNVYPTGAGATTGYIDLSWPAAKNASNYRLQLYNGKGWRTIYTGTDLNYSTKGKRFWPTPTQYGTIDSLTGGVAFRNGDGMELPMDPSPMYTASTGSTSTSKAYQFRIVADYPLGTSTPSTVVKPTLEGIIPDKPNAPTYSAFANETDNKGYFNLEWDGVEGATSYDIEIFNGNNYERFSVGDETSWTSKGKRIFPTEAQAATLTVGQTNAFRKSGDGRDFLTDPRILYRKTGTGYANSTNYYAKVIAKSSKGESSASTFTRIYFPIKNVKAETTGYEDNRNQSSGFLFSKWEQQPEALGYLVYLFNGQQEQLIAHKSKNELTWTSRDQKIWPKDDQGYVLRTKNDGKELPFDPSSTYEKAGSEFSNDRGYYLKIRPYRAINTSIPSEEVFNPERYLGKSSINDKDNPIYIVSDDTNGLGLQDFYPTERFNDIYINTRNDNQLVINEDLDVDLSAYNIMLERTYNSISDKTGLLGDGWSSFLDEKLSILKGTSDNPEIINFTESSGTNHLFIKNIENEFIPPTGIDLSILKKINEENIYYGIKKLNKDIVWFDENGYPTELENASGKVIKISYTGNSENKKPIKISSSSNLYNIEISYLNDSSLIETIVYSNGKDVLSEKLIFSYEYKNNMLTKVTEKKVRPNSSKIIGTKEYEYRVKDTNSTNYNNEINVMRKIYSPDELENISDNQIETVTFDSKKLEESDFQTEYLIKNSKENKITKFLINRDEENNYLQKINTSNETISSSDSTKIKTEDKFYSNEGLLKEEIEKKSSKTSITKYDWKDNRITSITYPDGEIEQFDFADRLTLSGNELSGNMTKQSSATESQVNKYDNTSNNLLRSIDEYNLLTTYGYDKNNRELGLILNNDFTSNTVEYDSQGNTIEESIRLTNGSNLVRNGSFETLEFWSGSEKSSEGLNGSALKLLGKTVKQIVPIVGSNAYNFTLHTKSAFGSYGSSRITFLDSSSKSIPSVEYRVYGADESSSWIKGIEEFTAPINATKAVIELTGTGKNEVLFDEVQLTSSPNNTSVSISGFNYVENGDFKDLAFWINSNSTLNTEGFSSKDSVILSENGEISQSVLVNQAKINPIYVTAMAKNANEKVVLSAKVKFSDQTEKNYFKKYDLVNGDDDFWQRKIIQIDEPKQIQSIVIKLLNSSTSQVKVDAARVSNGRVVQESTFNSENLLITFKDLDGRNEFYTYDQYGKNTSKKHLNHEETMKYDELGRITSKKLSNGTSIILTYDEVGKIKTKKLVTKEQLNNPEKEVDSSVTMYSYNKFGDIEKKSSTSGNYIDYKYNTDGEVSEQIFSNESSIKNTYDVEGMLKKIAESNKNYTAANSFDYVYTNQGKPQEIKSSLLNASKNYSYNTMVSNNDSLTENVKNIKDYFGNTQSWSYLTNNNIQTDVVTAYEINSHKVNYKYDHAVRNHEVETEGLMWKFRHGEGNTTNQIIFPNGEMVKEYTDNNFVKSVMYKNKNKISFYENYIYDDHGLISEKHSKEQVTKYKYDENHQLIEDDSNGTKKIYNYDDRGNLIRNNGIESLFDKDNQLISFDNAIISYDKSGNRIDDNLFSYKWDGFNNLLNLKRKSLNDYIDFQYDEQSRRVQKKSGTTITRYIYDGDSSRLLAETDENGKELRRYLYSADNILLSVKINNQWYHYQRDYKENVVAIVDNLGNIAARYEYDAWGNLTKETLNDSNVKNQPILYSSYYLDRESNMYYLNNRYYNPLQAVFISPDIYDGPQDLSISSSNRYSYVSNLPTMYIDPSGNKEEMPNAPVGGGGGFRYVPRFKSGYAGEDYLRDSIVGGGKHQTFPTTAKLGRRVVDVYYNGVAHESKVGKAYLSQFIRKQVLKDAYLVGKKTVKKAEWHFFLNAKGKGGPSKPLREFLEDHGIKVHTYL